MNTKTKVRTYPVYPPITPKKVIPVVQRNWKVISSLAEFEFYRSQYHGVNHVSFYRKWKAHNVKTTIRDYPYAKIAQLIEARRLFVCLNEIKPHWEFSSIEDRRDYHMAFNKLYSSEMSTLYKLRAVNYKKSML